MRQQHNLSEPLNLVDLRARRAALNARLSKGLDALRSKEEAGDTGPEYQSWLAAWQGLLCEYEGLCEQIAACRALAARPGPTGRPPDGSPPATPAAPRQLGLFAGTVVTAYTGR